MAYLIWLYTHYSIIIFGRKCLIRYFANLFLLSAVARDTNSQDSLTSLVGTARFELATSCSQGRRATKLRYIPMKIVFLVDKGKKTMKLTPRVLCRYQPTNRKGKFYMVLYFFIEKRPQPIWWISFTAVQVPRASLIGNNINALLLPANTRVT